jgi:hypothetical protein
VTTHRNTVTFTGATLTNDALDFNNLVSPIVDGWTVNATSVTDVPVMLKVYASSSSICGANCGTAQVTNNTITHGVTSATGEKSILIGNSIENEWGASTNNMLDGAIITGNTVIGPSTDNTHGAHGILYGYNKNGTMAGNLSVGNLYGVPVKGTDTWTSGGVWNNIVKDDLSNMYASKGTQNVVFYNNTAYLSVGKTLIEEEIAAKVNSDSGAGSSPATGTVEKNNILYTQQPNPAVGADASSSTGLTIDYNLQFTNGSHEVQALIGATTYTVFATWQGAGFDTHGNHGDPSFYLNGTDYHLRAESSAIARATSGGPSTDFYGNLRIPGFVSLGAVEYQPRPMMAIQ